MSYDRTHKQTNKQIDKQRFLLSNPTHAADTANLPGGEGQIQWTLLLQLCDNVAPLVLVL